MGNKNLDSLWLYGGYPDRGVLDSSMFPDWQSDFLTALTSSDLPKWGLTASAPMTKHLLQMVPFDHS